MSNIKQIISLAGKNKHTIILQALEKNGSVETREAEPYSYRFKKGHELFFCYDIAKHETRSFLVKNIIYAEETTHIFRPRWPIEV